ncbi:50S ribosomal protein L6 [Candidatus Beckwithbacteria bacterium]|nr:50S ribosomal protein L6 [Candidatus Beckwithbacteria bacterium]
MSRIGKQPVSIPEGVTVALEDRELVAKGPKGENRVKIQHGVTVTVADKEVVVTRKNDAKAIKALHGTTRNLINNAVIGAAQGYQKTLKLIGTGYRVAQQGSKLQISLGFSHPIDIEPVEGITFSVDGQDTIVVSGCNKHLVGQVAANIRAKRPPEPYKGKGIRYENEQIIKKAGKTSKGDAA